MGEELKKKRIIAVVVFNLILLKKWDFNLTEKHNQINFKLFKSFPSMASKPINIRWFSVILKYHV